MEWSCNGQFHMKSITIPHGFHWIPWTSPHGFHGTSPYGFHGTNRDGINDYHICSVLTILRKNKFTLSQHRTLSHTSKTNAKAHCATTALLYGKQKSNIYYPRHVSTQMRQRWLKHCHVASSFPPPPSSTQPIHHRHQVPATTQQQC